jgi:hypothetical protein
LYKKYRPQLDLPSQYEIDEPLFAEMIEYIDSSMNQYFNWEEEAREHTALNSELLALLKSSITVNEQKKAYWNKQSVDEVILEFEAKKLFWIRDLESAGLQEKYLKSDITAQEPLTELDVRRFIIQTGMLPEIKVVSLDNLNAHLKQAVAQQSFKNTLYTIAYMVNVGTIEKPEWASLLVQVDPLSRKVQYKINLEHAKKKEAIETRIKQELSASLNFIADLKGNLVTHANVGGYNILHALYRDEALQDKVAVNALAYDFAKIEKDTHDVRRAVYQAQLSSIAISPSDRKYLGQIDIDNKLKNWEKQLDLLVKNTPKSGGGHPIVAEQIADLRLYHTKVIFPIEQNPIPPLTSADYQQFLLAMHHKFQGSHKVLQEMVINYLDKAAFEGLLAFQESKLPLPFRNLTVNIEHLNLDDEQARAQFLFDIKTLLLSFSDRRLGEFKLISKAGMSAHPQFAEMFKDIEEFIKSRAIAVNFTLPPPYSHSEIQAHIDEVVSPRIRNKNWADFTKEAEDFGFTKRREKDIRKRPKGKAKQTAAIDIELQQEQQQQADVAMETQASVETQAPDNDGMYFLYTLSSFANAVTSGAFDKNKSYLLPKTDIASVWRKWVGALSDFDADFHCLKLSHEACIELINYPDKYEYGLDQNNLPPGFIFLTQGDTKYIHFDARLKFLADYQPLKVQATKLPEAQPIPKPQFNYWLEHNPAHMITDAWNRIASASQYDKNAQQVFRQYLPQMLLLDDHELARLFELCIINKNSESVLDVPKLQTLLRDISYLNAMYLKNPQDVDCSLSKLFSQTQKDDVEQFIQHYQEHPAFNYQLVEDDPEIVKSFEDLRALVPDLNFNALLQVYIQAGAAGLAQFKLLVESDPALFNRLNAVVFKDYKSYMPLLHKDMATAMRSLNALSPNAYLWWNRLLEMHCQAQQEVNFLDLVNAFIQFRTDLQKLPASDGTILDFPDQCALKECNSMPMTLSRILTLLCHVSQENRTAQWHELQGLDFSSTGFIKAISDTRSNGVWAFITAEMQLSAEVERAQNFFATNYNVCDLNEILFAIPFEEIERQAFRFLAYKGYNEQLPLDIYRKASIQINEANFSRDHYRNMYVTMLSATTQTNRNLIKRIDQADEDMREWIQLMAVPPWQVTEQVKHALRDNAFWAVTLFQETPPLPVCRRLTALFMNMFNTVSPFTLVVRGLAVQNQFERLRDLEHMIGPAVYEGLLHYNVKAASEIKAEKNLLARYIDTVEAVSNIFQVEDLEPDRGTTLIRVISLFMLGKANVKQITNAYLALSSEEEQNKREEILALLHNISLNEDSKSLSSSDLKYILATIKGSEHSVIELVHRITLPNGQKLSSYYDERFLRQYGSKEIPEPVIGTIHREFPDEHQQKQIKDMLLRFALPMDSMSYGEVVARLGSICKKLSTAEQRIFIAKLASTEGLYTDNKTPLADNDFMHLLETISAQNSIDGFMFFMFAAKKHPEQQDLSSKAIRFLRDIFPSIKSMKDLKISESNWIPRVLDTLLKTSEAEAKSVKYKAGFIQLFQGINKLAANNPGCTDAFLKLYDTYLTHYDATRHGALLPYLNDFVTRLEMIFAGLDKNMVLSLCVHFNDDTNPHLQPEGLLALLDEINKFEPRHKSSALKIAIVTLNSGQNYSLDQFKTLYRELKTDPEFCDELDDLYKKAPYPTIEQLLDWFKKCTNPEGYKTELGQCLKEFHKVPWHREEENGFQAGKALTQLEQFAFNGRKTSAKELDAAKTYFAKFEQLTKDLQRKELDELLTILRSFKDADPETIDYDTLVAVAAELLHRSKGLDLKDGEAFIPGSSMEINTTQYLAILSLIKTPGAITCQIGTGEGKTRIMMIANACQYALGQTVDFVTSDMQLATRDYMGYQAYFEMIGAETSMIYADSAPAQYKKGGINFFDAHGLNLFRNKARSMGKEDLILDTNEDKRTLLADEADKLFFDMAGTRFNFSMQGDDSVRNMEWVYPLLMKYFEQEMVLLSENETISPLELYFENVDLSREKFLDFASINCTKEQFLRLQTLAEEQIEQWQVSAYTAKKLEFQDDFDIAPDGLIRIATGSKISSEALVRFANRIAKSSQFSFGVQQCLHARLNNIRENPQTIDDAQLIAAVARCEHPFHIQDEKQIVYSTTSKNLLDDYKEGSIKAVTGTAGSKLERAEAEKLYGQRDQTMQFIDVPRDQGLRRKDKAVFLTANRKAQIKQLVREIKEARAKNQPILLITETDKESKKLYKALKKVFPIDIQHVHSQTPAKEEQQKIKQAGLPGYITVSTGMLGRGVDFSLDPRTRQHGLKVLVTYLPTVRDLGQIFGRAGRFGAEGEAKLVLDKARMKKALGKTTLTDGFYCNAEAYLEREQAIMDRNKQLERLIKNTVGDFRKQLTNNFFKDLLSEVDFDKSKTTLLPIWTRFFEKSDKAWNESWLHIQEALDADNVNVQEINNILAQLQVNTQRLWSTFRHNVEGLELAYTSSDKTSQDLLIERLPALALDNKTEKLLAGFDIKGYSLNKVKQYDEYEPAHDGRAISYSKFGTEFIASVKGWLNIFGLHLENARRPFANFRAWLEGRGRLFPNLRATVAGWFDSSKPVAEEQDDLASDGAAHKVCSYSLFAEKGLLNKGAGVPTDEGEDLPAVANPKPPEPDVEDNRPVSEKAPSI